ncbi:MAG: hypothetical protein IKB78_01390 [Clostridia bacterium]|nr:hypothetical protein [Clostridia bacterium]
MGSFANGMFSVLLGWVHGAAGWAWKVLFNEEDGGLISWIGENWLGLIIALCVICMAVDAVIHLLRWRSHRVWISFFRRLTGKADQGQDTGGFSGRMRREVYYADGTAHTEEVEVPQEEWFDQPQSASRLSSAEMPEEYVQAYKRPKQLKYQEEMNKELPVQGLEDYPQPPRAEEQQPAAPRRKRMARLHAYLDGDDEMELRYRPVPPAVNKRDAYHEPFIPPQWKKPANTGAANEEDTHDSAY